MDSQNLLVQCSACGAILNRRNKVRNNSHTTFIPTKDGVRVEAKVCGPVEKNVIQSTVRFGGSMPHESTG